MDLDERTYDVHRFFLGVLGRKSISIRGEGEKEEKAVLLVSMRWVLCLSLVVIVRPPGAPWQFGAAERTLRMIRISFDA